jgi:hypothetical protein
MLKKEFTVYYQFNGQKLKSTVRADSFDEAVQAVKDKMIIHAVVPAALYNDLVPMTNEFLETLDEKSRRYFMQEFNKEAGINNDSAAKFDNKNGLHR